MSEKNRGRVLLDSTIQEGNRVDVLVAYRDGQQEVAMFLLTRGLLAS